MERTVVANDIPISFVGIEFNGEATNVSDRVLTTKSVYMRIYRRQWTNRASPRSLYGTEAYKGRRGTRRVGEHRRKCVLRGSVVIDLEVAVCTGASGVHYTLCSLNECLNIVCG